MSEYAENEYYEVESTGFEFLGLILNLPGVRVNREDFLRSVLSHYPSEVVEDAIQRGTASAGIPKEEIEKMAKKSINQHWFLTTTVSAAAGIPGGVAMLASIPADLVQFYGNYATLAQKLVYLYGWKSIDELGYSEKVMCAIMLGIGMGIDGITGKVIQQVCNKTITHYGTRAGIKALGKTAIYAITKKVAIQIGYKVTKKSFAQLAAKAVPVVGAVASGTITLATFKPMANKLNKELSINYDNMVNDEAIVNTWIVEGNDESTGQSSD